MLIKIGEEMYLHIGNDIIIKKKDILFILDYKNLKENRILKKLIEKIDKKNITDISGQKQKTIIIKKENETIKGYISNISSNTIPKRKFLDM